MMEQVRQGVLARLFASIRLSFRMTAASFRMVRDFPKVLLLPLGTLAAVTALVVAPLSLLMWGVEYHPGATGRFFATLYWVTVEAARNDNWSLAISSAIFETYLLWSLWMIPVLTAVLYFTTVGMHVATQQIRREQPDIRAGFKLANRNFGRIVALAAFSATVYAWVRYLVFQVIGMIPILGRIIMGGLRLVLTAVTYLMLPIVVYERADQPGGLLDRQPGEVAELDQAGEAGVHASQAVERVVECEHVEVGLDRDRDRQIELFVHRASAALPGQPPPRLVHQDASHGVGRRAKEVGAAAPVDARLVHQPQIGLVHERARLEQVSRPFPAQQVGGDGAHLAVDPRHQVIERVAVAGRVDRVIEVLEGDPVGAAGRAQPLGRQRRREQVPHHR